MRLRDSSSLLKIGGSKRVEQLSRRTRGARERFKRQVGYADSHGVSEDKRSRSHAFAFVALGITIAALAGWTIYTASQPSCGPPGNTPLGRIDQYLPWAFMAALALSVAASGAMLHRAPLRIIATVLCLELVAVPVGAAITFGSAAAGNCFA
jgi:hypothetical protein